MKKFIRVMILTISLTLFSLFIFFIFYDLQIMEESELKELIKGKQYWEWASPYGNMNVHYIEKGEGDHHVLLLHGFRAHTYTWKHLIEPLTKAGYRVWAMDLVGYGLSDKPTNVPYHIDFFIHQIETFMKSMGISKAHIVGNSLGGGLALCLALDYPEHVKTLTLISALGYPRDMPLYISIGRHFHQIWGPFLGPAMIRKCLQQIVYHKEKVSDEQVEAYCLPYRFPGGVMSTLLTLRQFDNQRLIEMSQRYQSLKNPTLIIWGQQDYLIPVSHYEKFLVDFPNAHRLLIQECGHIPQEEEPEQVLAHLLNFLKQVDKPLSKTYSNLFKID